LQPVDGSACPQSSEWCPQSIGITGRLQSESVAAFVGIRKISNARVTLSNISSFEEKFFAIAESYRALAS